MQNRRVVCMSGGVQAHDAGEEEAEDVGERSQLLRKKNCSF